MTPQLLQEFQKAPPRRVVWWGMVIVAAWLLLFIGDWYGRMIYFNWWKQVCPPVARASKDVGLREQWHDRRRPGRMGDLLALLGMPWLNSKFFEYRQFEPLYRDLDGYFNPEGMDIATTRVTVVGHSFMVALGPHTFAHELSEALGEPVYNRGQAAVGIFSPLADYLRTPHYADAADVLVWCISARGFNGENFALQPVERWFSAQHKPEVSGEGNVSPKKKRRIRWSKLRPQTLHAEWPSTSISARLSRRLVGWGQYVVLRTWPQDVFGVDDPAFGSMLFYRSNLDVFNAYDPATEIPPIVRQIKKLSDYMHKDGVNLIVVLIPEREQLYRSAIPQKYQERLNRMAALQNSLAASLVAADVPTVNLLPIFQKEIAAGHRLHWRDDTHWNGDAMQIGAQEATRLIRAIRMAE